MPSLVPIESCSVAHALDIIGDRWTFLILREAFYGVRRFDEMQHDLSIPRAILSKRLAEFVSNGLMTRESYREADQRARYEYRLTKKGADLRPVIIALMQWGDRYATGNDQPSLTLSHNDCGAPVHVAFVCEQDHIVRDWHEVSANIDERFKP